MKDLVDSIVVLILGIAVIVTAAILQSGWEIIRLGSMISAVALANTIYKAIKK